MISDIATGKHPICKKLESAKRPVIIVGVDQLSRPDGEAILAALHTYAAKISKPVRNIPICRHSQILANSKSTSFSRAGTPSMCSIVLPVSLVPLMLDTETPLTRLSNQSQMCCSCWVWTTRKSPRISFRLIALSYILVRIKTSNLTRLIVPKTFNFYFSKTRTSWR